VPASAPAGQPPGEAPLEPGRLATFRARPAAAVVGAGADPKVACPRQHCVCRWADPSLDGRASTAAPLSALSATYWNPATISGLERSQLEVGVDLLMNDQTVRSSIGGVAAESTGRGPDQRKPTQGRYTFNQNPLQDSESFFKIASPLICEHMLSFGGSLRLDEHVSLNAAYSHYFENSRTGPIVSPGLGAVPDSSVTNELSAGFISFGILMQH